MMCIESIINHKIKKIIFGSSSLNKNKWNYFQYLIKKGKLDVVIDMKSIKCKKIIKNFFLSKRY